MGKLNSSVLRQATMPDSQLQPTGRVPYPKRKQGSTKQGQGLSCLQNCAWTILVQFNRLHPSWPSSFLLLLLNLTVLEE